MHASLIAEFRTLINYIETDCVVKDLNVAMNGCPYVFPGLKTVTDELTKRRFYTLGHYYARLLRLIELTKIYNPSIRRHLIDVDNRLVVLEFTADKRRMLREYEMGRKALCAAASVIKQSF